MQGNSGSRVPILLDVNAAGGHHEGAVEVVKVESVPEGHMNLEALWTGNDSRNGAL